MRIGTAEPDSTFITQGQALAAVLPRHGVDGKIEVMTSPHASIDNANRLETGEIEFGFMAANWIGRARRGEAPFVAPLGIAMVAPMNAGPLFFIALKTSGLRTFDDLVGKRVSVGLEASGMTQHAHTMLRALGRSIDGITPVYLPFVEGAEALKCGDVDAQLQCPIPNKVMSDLDADADLTVLEFAPAQLETLLATVPFYRRAPLRKGRLRALDRDVIQPGVLNVLVCHRSADARMVEAMARGIYLGADDLATANALFDGLADLYRPLSSEGAKALEFDGVTLHPGAMSAYRAAGLIP
ncbi:MAG: TAXI family TRAP transporter solute-binding subunit [Hyphomicrobiaceae bacterium]